MITQLYHGDCLEVMKLLPQESVDAIITDPPYGIDYQSSRRTDKEKRMAKIANDKAPFIWFLYDAYRVIKEGGALLCFCRWDTQEAFKLAMQWANFHVKSCIVWDRKHHGMGDLKSAFAPCHDVILFGVKGKFIFPNKRPKDVISYQRLSADALRHPNEKPIGLMEELIQSVTSEDQVVLDPFMGSGATGLACVNKNRRFIGIELDNRYYDLAEKRIREPEVKQC